MEAVLDFLLRIVYYFMNNWIAAALLAVVLLVALIKKPTELFKVTALAAFLVGVLYVMIYLEKSMFSGAVSKERATDIERKLQ